MLFRQVSYECLGKNVFSGYIAGLVGNTFGQSALIVRAMLVYISAGRLNMSQTTPGLERKCSFLIEYPLCALV